MSKSTEDSKIKQSKVISDDNTELTDEALEQVNGGTFGLKTDTQPYSKSSGGGSGKVNVRDMTLTKYVDS